MADRIGRRGGLLACGLIFSAGVILEITASDLPVLLGARVLAGLAIGAASIISTLYPDFPDFSVAGAGGLV